MDTLFTSDEQTALQTLNTLNLQMVSYIPAHWDTDHKEMDDVDFGG